MQHGVILRIAEETGLTPPEVCLSWSHQRENNQVGYVSMAERSDWIRNNLSSSTRNALSREQMIAIEGDGTDQNPGINSNNRLIWGQVFFWPEARILGHARDVLWNDTQVFETSKEYERFKAAVADLYGTWKETAVDLPLRL
jgi:diketogulonate reductase-like aldo/keto reductase